MNINNGEGIYARRRSIIPKVLLGGGQSEGKQRSGIVRRR
jgi:hypothetical protein